MYMDNPTNRPLGITIIALVMGFLAIVNLCGSLTSLGFAPFAVFGEGGFGQMFSQGIGSLFGLFLALGGLFVAWGLWTLQPWAFWATVIIEVLQLLNGGLAFSTGIRSFFCGVNVIPLLILLYMFLDKDVRRAFRT
jgi:hypothetical protein